MAWTVASEVLPWKKIQQPYLAAASLQGRIDARLLVFSQNLRITLSVVF